MKKVCPCCGRNRKIGKFGKRSDNPDGKNIYCRDCMKDKRVRYDCTPVGMVVKKKSVQKWKKNNQEHVKEYNQDYYQKNKSRILYNKKTRKCSIITEKHSQRKINKGRQVCIVIDPKRK